MTFSLEYRQTFDALSESLARAGPGLVLSNYVAFEGPPGAGKSTLLLACAKDLPGCEIAREIQDPPEPRGDSYIRLEAERKRAIETASLRGLVHVSDRSVLSTLAVTLAKDRWSDPTARRFSEWTDTISEFQRAVRRGALAIPEVVLHVDVSASVARQRQLSRDANRADSVWVAEKFVGTMREAYDVVYGVILDPCPVLVLTAVLPDRQTDAYDKHVRSARRSILSRSAIDPWRNWP